MKDNDVIHVRVTWNSSVGAEGYSVYRQGLNEASWTGIASGIASTTTEYFDTSAPEGDYRYFVVATRSVSGVQEESAASTNAGGDPELDHAVDTFDPAEASVQNLKIFDGRHDYTTWNRNSRVAYVEWSRVPETKLVGYHVYRKCRYDYECSIQTFPPNSHMHFACQHSWERLTGGPLPPEAGQWFQDRTVGGLNGCYMYAVRPVGPDGVEGDVTKVAGAMLAEGYDALGDGFSHALDYDWNPSLSDFPAFVTMNLLNSINGKVRGTGDPTGPPPPPSGLTAAWRRRRLSADAPLARSLVVNWSIPSSASDLAGYHVEVAGSYSGPWTRVNTNLVAWFEDTYVVANMTNEEYSDYPEHLDCTHVRVIAVDEEGNESPPAYPPGFPSTGLSCPETPGAPRNLRASSVPGASPCRTLLEWDAPADGPAPAEYRIYRYRVDDGLFLYFYLTQVQNASVGTSYVETGQDTNTYSPWQYPNTYCPYRYNLSSPQCGIGYLEAYFVTARGAEGGESPKSNIVFWDCNENPGYARLSPMSEEIFDAIAAGPEPDGSEVLASLALTSTQGDTPTPSVPAPVLSIAPPLGLGQAANPPWKLFDLHVDHLGSTRLVTDDSGAVTSRHDYMPFGQEISQGITYNTHAFTGHERDKATGLDYMLARYYSASLARFLSFDPGHTSAQSNTPSSWNRFAYVTNQPIVMTDPDGEAGVYMRWLDTPVWDWWPGTFPRIQDYVFTQHWQIFYSDGSDIGFFSDGLWKPDEANASLQATYRPLLEGLDDSTMMAAVRMTMPRFSLAYDNPCDNCQDAVLAVLENYNVVAKKRGVMSIDADTLENLRQNTLCEMVKIVAPAFAPDPVRFTPKSTALDVPLGGSNFRPGSMNRMKVMVGGVGSMSMGD